MSINLKKGESCGIPKINGMSIGLGWDTRADLDAHAYLYKEETRGIFGKIIGNKKYKEVGHIYYNNRFGNGINISPDNLTGEGDGDDETITVKFDELPNDIVKIEILVNIYSGGSDFSEIKGAYVRLIDNNTNTEICKYNLTDEAKGRTYTFGELIKNNSIWNFKAN